MTPDEYCLTRAGGRGSALHYSLLFEAPAQRRAVIAVHAFMHEIGEILDEVTDPGVAQTKLAWWHEEIARMYGGEPRHPVTKALAPTVASHGLEQRRFADVLNETAVAFARLRYTDFESVYAHCRRTGGVAGVLTTMILGSTDVATLRHAETLGAALRLTDILGDIGQDVRRDRVYLPTDDLRRFGVAGPDLSARRHTPAFESLMQFEIARNLDLYDRALAELPHSDRRRQLPGVILANIARAQLDELRRDRYRVLEHRIALTPLRKLWIAWRTRLGKR